MAKLGCRITILVDNIASRVGLCGEAGLSILIESNEGRVLLDTGQGIAIANNLWELFPGLDSLDAVAFSHGHYDHTGGIAALLSFLGLDSEAPDADAVFPKAFVHPEIEIPKYAIHGEDYLSIGLTETLDVYFPGSSIVKTAAPVEMIPGVFFLGELPREYPAPYPPDYFFRHSSDDDTFEPDPLLDDTALVVEQGDGIIVVTGCTHSGLGNLGKALTEHFPGKHIKAVMGGMHLAGADDDFMTASIEALLAMQPDRIIPHHCTGVYGYECLKKALGLKVELGSTGAAYTFA